MAGLGRKVFTRETLTSADVNGYFMDQAVMHFASASARSAAIPSPSDGMVTYLDDVKRGDVYEDAAWQPAFYGTIQRIKGTYNGSTDAGGVVTVIHNLGVIPSAYSVTLGSFAAQHVGKLVVSALSTTQMQLVMYNTTNGATIGSNAVTFGWSVDR